MKSNYQYKRSNQNAQQRGFTLIELMVGLVIGLLATLAIMQVMSIFEEQKRTTTGTADSQTNGNVALYSITKDIQSAGYGLMFTGKHVDKLSAIDCATLTPGEAATTAGMTSSIASLTPVVIQDGGATGSDIIITHSADTSLGGLPTRILTPPISRTITVASNLGCKNNDFVLINAAGACAMSRLPSSNALIGNIQVTLDGLETVPVEAQENAVLSCLGNWRTNTYALSGGNLQTNGVDAVADVVNMQAQYGVSATVNSNTITSWVSATGSYGSTMDIDHRNLIKAVRLAVVTRNPKLEITDVTPSCSVTTPVGLTINLSADTNCKRYRYNVYETVIPLRNMIWSKDPV
jgi:type IV pilus assembly protein PilW